MSTEYQVREIGLIVPGMPKNDLVRTMATRKGAEKYAAAYALRAAPSRAAGASQALVDAFQVVVVEVSK